MVGTPDYMAPEQAESAGRADIRADIYSLGCTLYHLLTGEPPFPGGAPLQKLFLHQSRQPRLLSELRRDVPAELAEVMRRMLAKDPAQRYQTPGEVAGELLPFVAGESPTMALTKSELDSGQLRAGAFAIKGRVQPARRLARLCRLATVAGLFGVELTGERGHGL